MGKKCLACHNEFPSLKILPNCGHKFCLGCLQRAVGQEEMTEMACQKCEKVTALKAPEDLPTIYFGNILCDRCNEEKAESDIWWCPECTELICSLCCMKDHDKEHRVADWDTTDAAEDCYEFYKSLHDQKSKEIPPSPQGMENINQLCEQIKERLVEKLQAEDNGSKSGPLIYERLVEKFGKMIMPEQDVPLPDQLMRHIKEKNTIQGVVEKLLKISLGDEEDESFKELQASGGSLDRKRITVSFPEGEDQKIATEIWNAANIQEEIVVEAELGTKEQEPESKQENAAPADQEEEPDEPKDPLTIFREEALDGHNKYREAHGAQPLKLSHRLNNFAQEWAEYLAGSGQFMHRPNNRYGENIYMMGRGGNVEGCDAVDAWYSEINSYNYSYPGFSMATGHFTQVVWNDSKMLGIGMAEGRNGIYVVGNYKPHGNMQGDFQDNVFHRQ